MLIDKAKLALKAKLDGKYLISTSDDHLSVEDVVLGYKQLHEIERVNRDLKHTVDVRPVYHRRGDRIKAHVLLGWLALLLIRITENESGASWRQLKRVFGPLWWAITPPSTATSRRQTSPHRSRNAYWTRLTSNRRSVTWRYQPRRKHRYTNLLRPLTRTSRAGDGLTHAFV